jgi:hypothetical protein
VLLLIDVLHHADDPLKLLRECDRVGRATIVIKDHTCRGPVSKQILKAMDYIGNRRHGVNLAYDYWPLEKWKGVFARLGFKVRQWKFDLRLYPAAFDWAFGRGLHLVAAIDIGKYISA